MAGKAEASGEGFKALSLPLFFALQETCGAEGRAQEE